MVLPELVGQSAAYNCPIPQAFASSAFPGAHCTALASFGFSRFPKSSNVILVGRPHANPWLELFEPESNFRMEIRLRRLKAMHTDQRLFINKHPRAGEQAVYANQAGN